MARGSGGGSVGRVVASNARGPQFKSSHRQKFILNIYCIEKTKIKKEAGNGPFKKNIFGQRYLEIKYEKT